MVKGIEGRFAGQAGQERPYAIFRSEVLPHQGRPRKVLQRHPLLERWGDKIKGRVRDYGDLMFTESEVIIGSMLILMKKHGVPSLPVHNSLIVPRQRPS